MDERVDLDSILDGEAAQPRQSEPTASVPEVRTEPAVAEPKGVKADAVPPPATPEANEPPHVPRKALEDERRKRQELEKQIEQLTKSAQQFQQPQQQPVQQVHQQQAQFPPRPDPHEDPYGAMEWDRAVTNYHMFETRVNLSQEFMRSQKSDYDQFERVFAEAASRDPGLVADLQRHPMPAKFAYEMGKQIAFIREVGTDPEAYKARLRQELQAELQQGQAAPQVIEAQAIKAPKSLASTPSAQPRLPNGQYTGRAELSDILGG